MTVIPNNITNRTSLNAWLADIGTNPLALSEVTEVLDIMVHEVLSRQASDINNGGIHRQVDFLLGADEDDVTGLVRDLRDAFDNGI